MIPQLIRPINIFVNDCPIYGPQAMVIQQLGNRPAVQRLFQAILIRFNTIGYSRLVEVAPVIEYLYTLLLSPIQV